MQGHLTEELDAEVLFNDRYALVVGEKSKWARRRSVELADLVDEPWIMTPLDALGELFVAKAFRTRGLQVPSFCDHDILDTSAQQSSWQRQIHYRSSGFGTANRAQPPVAQRAADRIGCSSPGGRCDAQE